MLLVLLTQQMAVAKPTVTPAGGGGAAPPYIITPLESWADPRLWELNQPHYVTRGATTDALSQATAWAVRVRVRTALALTSSAAAAGLQRRIAPVEADLSSRGDVSARAETSNPAQEFNKGLLLAEIDEDLLVLGV